MLNNINKKIASVFIGIKKNLLSINSSMCLFIFLNILFLTLLFLLNKATPYLVDDFFYMKKYGTDLRNTNIFDVLFSTYNSYYGINGRILPNFLNYYFLIYDKLYFNIFNTIIFIILVYIIYMYITRGKIVVNNSIFSTIFSLLFLLLPPDNAGEPYLWHSGSFNYAWTITLVLVWFYPYYIKSILNKNISLPNNFMFLIVYFVLSIMISISHESHVGLLVFMLIISIIYQKYIYKKKIQLWQIIGMIGVLIGATIICTSPANWGRMGAIGYMSRNIIIEVILRVFRLFYFSLTINPIVIPMVFLSYYIYIKKNNINKISDKKNMANLFFIVSFFGSIYQHVLINGYIERAFSITAVMGIIYFLFVIYNYVYDNNKLLVTIISLSIFFSNTLMLIHRIYKMSGFQLFAK